MKKPSKPKNEYCLIGTDDKNEGIYINRTVFRKLLSMVDKSSSENLKIDSTEGGVKVSYGSWTVTLYPYRKLAYQIHDISTGDLIDKFKYVPIKKYR